MQSPFENRQRQFNMLNCFVVNWRYADLLPSTTTLSRHCFVLNSFSLLIISAWPKCMLCIVICVSIYCDMWMVVSLRMSWIFVPSISVGWARENLCFLHYSTVYILFFLSHIHGTSSYITSKEIIYIRYIH